MGLESVELVMEVEEAFGFSIRDEDAATFYTVGQLYDYIMAHRFEGKQPGCLTSVTFYRLRRALMSVLWIARRDVRLSSDLNAVIPARRRQVWSDLQEAIGLRLPKLVLPVWARAARIAVGFVLGTALFLVFLDGRWKMAAAFPEAFNTALCLTLVLMFLLNLGTKPLAVAFRREFATVGGLTKCILKKNCGAISDDCQHVNAEEVWNTLRTVIVEQLGVRPDDVTKEARFVEDLGMS